MTPEGFWPFRLLTASSASARLSNRMKATPLDTPAWRQHAQLFRGLTKHLASMMSVHFHTCRLVNEYTRVNDAPELGKHVLHVLLGHGLGQAADVQVSILYCVRAGSSIRNLTTGNTSSFKILLTVQNIPTTTTRIIYSAVDIFKLQSSNRF